MTTSHRDLTLPGRANRRMRKLALGLLAGTTLVGPALAQSIWTGTSSADWFDMTNWATNAVPTNADNAEIGTATPNAAVIDGADASAMQVTVATGLGGGGLSILNGGRLTNSGPAYLARAAGGSGTATVSGAGSSWSTSNVIVIGEVGSGLLSISDGGVVDTLQTMAGIQAGSQGHIDIGGMGSALNVSSILGIGMAGAGSMTVSNGGTVASFFGGVGAGGSGVVTVTGVGSVWNNATQLWIGPTSAGTLVIADGGVVTSHSTVLGTTASGTGTIEVIGQGSILTNATDLTVGGDGAGNLVIANGGVVHSVTGGAAQNAGSTGTITITGAGSAWNVADLAGVGNAGHGTLTLADGGSLSTGAAFGLVIAGLAGSTGVLNVGAAAGDAASAAGSLLAPVAVLGTGTGTINFNHTGTDYDFDAAIVSMPGGTATINQLAGVTRLTADSWTFGGTTNVSGGKLIIADRLGGTINVQAGGAIGGTGEVGTLGFGTGGIAAPGNSIGTMLVTDVTFNAGSFYDVEVNALNQSDLIIASNTATLNGGTVRVSMLPDYTPGNVYNIVYAANGLAGTFAGATTGLAFVTPVLSYDAQNAFVTLIQSANFLGVAQTPNQLAVAGALMGIDPSNPIAQSMMGLTIDEARAAFDGLSGEGHASVRSVLLEDSRMPREAAFDRLSGDKEGLWALVQASHMALASDGNAAPLGVGGLDVAGGSDAHLGDWLVGLMLHAGTTGYSVPDRSTTGTIGDIGLGLYAGTEWDATALDLGLDLAWHGIGTRRSLAFGPLADTLTASYGATTGQVFGRLSHDFELPQFVLRPYGEAAYAVTATGSFAEAGGPAALTIAQGTSTALFTTLGLDLQRELLLDDGSTLMLTAGLGWQHAFADTPTAANALPGIPAFTVAGVSQPRDALVLEAGLGLQLESGVRLDLSYDGVLAGSAQTHALKATLAGAL